MIRNNNCYICSVTEAQPDRQKLLKNNLMKVIAINGNPKKEGNTYHA